MKIISYKSVEEMWKYLGEKDKRDEKEH